jgi:uncharacterized protein YndB with AHSA1/START domain
MRGAPPAPTGRLEPRTDGRPGGDVVFERTFRAPAAEIWAAVTHPERLERWIGTWQGRPSTGRVTFTMTAEDGAEPEEVRIERCEEPSILTVAFRVADTAWRVSLRLAESDGTTTLALVHHLQPGDDLPSYGPGWEYYLDRLVAVETSRVAADTVSFDDYYPAQAAYYEKLASAL